MRQKSRIKPFLNWIEKEWENAPDQRFGQLLINLGIIKDDIETWNKEIYDYDIPFKYLRDIIVWGIYLGDSLEKVGKNIVRLPLRKQVPISSLEDSHIKNILKTQKQISKELRKIFKKELDWRKNE